MQPGFLGHLTVAPRTIVSLSLGVLEESPQTAGQMGEALARTRLTSQVRNSTGLFVITEDDFALRIKISFKEKS